MRIQSEPSFSTGSSSSTAADQSSPSSNSSRSRPLDFTSAAHIEDPAQALQAAAGSVEKAKKDYTAVQANPHDVVAAQNYASDLANAAVQENGGMALSDSQKADVQKAVNDGLAGAGYHEAQINIADLGIKGISVG